MRVFTGVPVPGEELDKIAELKVFSGLGKVFNREQAHITVNFIGEAGDEDVAGITAGMDGALKGIKKFTVSMNEVKAFPDEKRAKIVWLNIASGAEPLKAIYRNIASMPAMGGIEKETREYLPHITLMRLRRPEDIMGFSGKVPEMVFTADRVVLYRSVLTGRGAVHTALHESVLE